MIVTFQNDDKTKSQTLQILNTLGYVFELFVAFVFDEIVLNSYFFGKFKYLLPVGLTCA